MKIVKLDINPEIDLAGVDAVALVEKPAIEEDFMYFSKHEEDEFAETYTDYPQGAVDAAKMGIKRNEALGNKCGTQVGKVRAQQLAQRKPISFDTVRRMRAFLIRQKGNYELAIERKDYNACGYISYLLWGGPEALPWAEKILRQAEGEEFAEVGPRGGIKESPKAPKSKTKNPNPKGQGTARGSASTTRGAKVDKKTEETLQKKSDEFNERYKKKLGYGTNVGTLKAVYQRGLGAYNTSRSPAVAAQGGAKQWALARVNAFLYLVKEGRPQNKKYTTDYDLLPAGHPKKEQFKAILSSIINEKILVDIVSDSNKVVNNTEVFSQKKTIYLVSCSSQKLNKPAKAKDLYNSPLFEKSLDYCYSKGATDKDIKILSGKYGLVDMNTVIKPYDVYLGDKSAEQKKEWAEEVFEVLKRRYDLETTKFVFLAGTDYTQYLEDMLPKSKDVLEGKKQGERLQYLDKFEAVGEIDGTEVYSTKEEAIIVAEAKGCSGYHEHEYEGKTVYMPCEKHPELLKDGFAALDEQQIVIGPLMKPNMLIKRIDEDGEPYYVYFTAETIKKIAYKMVKDKLIDRVNIEHDSLDTVDAYLVESWIIDGEYDKSKNYGFNLPIGTWMAMYKIEDKDIWDEYVKTGKVKGYSVEGMFGQYAMSKCKAGKPCACGLSESGMCDGSHLNK